MSDRLRFVTIGSDGRARTLQTLEAPTVIFKGRDTFDVSPGDRQLRTVQSSGDRYFGSRAVGETRSNSTIQATVHIKGASRAETTQRVEAMLEVVDRATGQVYVEWRPDGMSRSVYSPVRAPATWKPAYRAVEWPQTFRIPVQLTIPVGPTPEGLPLDIWEHFAPPADELIAPAHNEILNPTAAVNVSGNVLSALTETAVVRTTANPISGRPAAYELANSVAPTQSVYGLLFNQSTFSTADPAATTRCNPGDTVAVRASMVAAAVVGTTFSRHDLYVRFYDAAGALIGASNLIQRVSNPAVGVQADLAGTIVAPAGAVYCSLYAVVGFAAVPTSFTWRVGALMLTVNPPGGTVPAYGDGDGPQHRWAGTRGLSRSISLEEPQLADYINSFGATLPAGSRTVVDPSVGLIHYDVNTATALTVHTGREPVPDTEVMVVGRFDVADAGGLYDHFLTPGLRYRTDDGRCLWATMSNGQLRIFRRDSATTFTQLGGIALGAAPTVGQRNWLLIRAEGNSITAERYLAPPNGRRINFSDQLRVTLPAGDSMGANRVGYPVLKAWSMAAGAAGAPATSVVEQFASLPYTYTAFNHPDSILLRSLPGTAPAVVDVAQGFRTGDVLVGGGEAFGMLSWRRRRGLENYLWNGDMDGSTALAGWRTTATTLVATGGALATSPVVPAIANPPAAALTVTNAAVANVGAWFRISERIKRGRTYTFETWAGVTAGAQGANWQVRAYDPAGAVLGDIPQPFNGYQDGLRSVSFVATADVEYVDIVVRNTSATAGNTIRLAAARFYEGEAGKGPTDYTQSNGRGAFVPFGLLQAENADVATGAVAFTDTALSMASNGRVMRSGTITGAQTFGLGFDIDPSLLEAPDFAGDDIDVEVFLNMNGSLAGYAGVPPTFNIVASTFPKNGPNGAAGYTVTRYTREFGSAGKPVPSATSQQSRLVRLGTLTWSRAQRSQAAIWTVKIDFVMPAAVGGGTIDFDTLILAPTAQRASSPTGRSDNSTSFIYPSFWGNWTGYDIKTIKSDGSGWASNSSRDNAPIMDSGIGGEPILLPPGDCEIFSMLYDQPPDNALWNASGGAGGGLSGRGPTMVRASVTPRYRLAPTG